MIWTFSVSIPQSLMHLARTPVSEQFMKYFCDSCEQAVIMSADV